MPSSKHPDDTTYKDDPDELRELLIELYPEEPDCAILSENNLGVGNQMNAYILIPNNLVARVEQSNKIGVQFEFETLTESGVFGEGLYAYIFAKRHSQYLASHAKYTNSKILELSLDASKCIDTTTDLGQSKLREIVKYASIGDEKGLIAYISASAQVKITGLIGIYYEGQGLYPKTILTKPFIGHKLCIYDNTIIKSYRFIEVT